MFASKYFILLSDPLKANFDLFKFPYHYRYFLSNFSANFSLFVIKAAISRLSDDQNFSFSLFSFLVFIYEIWIIMVLLAILK